MVVRSISGNRELLVTWQQEPGELQEHVVDWIRDGDPLENLSWVWLPPGNLSAVLPGEAEGHLGSHFSCWRTEERLDLQKSVQVLLIRARNIH